MANHTCCDDRIDVMRFRAWRALSYDNQAALSPALGEQLFPSPLVVTAAQLETFAACPFQHFVRHGLQLADRPADDVTGGDLSRVYHDLLERLVRDLLRQQKDFSTAAAEWTDAQVRGYARQVGERLKGEVLLESARGAYLLRRIERTLQKVVASQRAMAARGRFAPQFVNLAFGEEGSAVGPLAVRTPRGRELRVRGRIDRVDVRAGGSEVAVFDYKLGGGQLALGEAYHGLSLQLLTYLLVLQQSGEQLVGRPVTPTAAFYLQLLRRLGDVKHPDEATDPADDRFHLACKPRGIVGGDAFPHFDNAAEPGRSDVLAVWVGKGGEFVDRGRTDVALAEEMTALLAHVRRRMAELADRMAVGDVAIAPYRIAKESPCGRCAYRPVCRFDVTTNRYNKLEALGREEVLHRVTNAGGTADSADDAD